VHMGALRLPNQITRDQFERTVKRLYEVVPDSVTTVEEGLPRKKDQPLRERLKDHEDPVQDVANDVRAAGILVPDESKSGALRFAHKSFMEYLLARVYADYVLRRDLEAVSSIVVTSQLAPYHILEHHESTAFFAEIIIGSAGSTRSQTAVSGAGAKLLFNVIAVNPRLPTPLAWILAWMSLRLLVRRAVRTTTLRTQRGTSVALYVFRSLIAPESLLVILPMGIAYFLLFKGYHTLWVVLLTVALATQLGTVVPRLFEPAVRLWFVSSVVAGMKPSDIAAVVGSQSVRQLAEYLKVSEKLSPE
jgi:hypothetical protein